MNFSTIKKYITTLEESLFLEKEPTKKFDILTQLIEYYTFTNTKKARLYIEEQHKLLEKIDNENAFIQYDVNVGFIENQHYNYFLSESHYANAVAKLEKSDDVDFRVEVYIDYTATCVNADRHEDAFSYLKKASRLLEAYPNSLLEARLIVRQGFSFLTARNYPKAIYFLLEAEDIFTQNEDELKFKDFYFLSLIYSGLGHVYAATKDVERSIGAYSQAVNLCEATGIKSRISFHYLNLGNAYLSFGDAENAENFFRKSINTLDDSSQNARAGALANLGKCFFNKEEYEEARKLYKKAKRLYHSMPEDDFYNFSVIEVFLAELYLAMGKQGKAYKHLRDAYDFAEKSGHLAQFAIVCKQISDYYAQKNNYKEAYKYQQLHTNYTTEHNEELQSQQIFELQTQFASEKQEQEANLLRMTATQLQHKALRAQMNPHFMFNVLNAIQKFINEGNVLEANTYLTKFADLMRDSLNNSDAEMITLEIEIEFLENYLNLNQKMRFNGKMNYEIIIDDEIEQDIFGVPSMIIQPYVENALEHGIKALKNGVVKIEFAMYDDNNLLCTIEDNGIGREKAAIIKEKLSKSNLKTKHRSMGTQITNERLAILHSRSEIIDFVKIIDLKDEYSGSATGTRVEVIIPIADVKRD